MYSLVSNKYVHWGRKQEAAAQQIYKIVLQYPDIEIRECGLFFGTNTQFHGECRINPLPDKNPLAVLPPRTKTRSPINSNHIQS